MKPTNSARIAAISDMHSERTEGKPKHWRYKTEGADGMFKGGYFNDSLPYGFNLLTGYCERPTKKVQKV